MTSAFDDVARFERQVAELTDRNEIANLVYRLGAFLDARRFDEMQSLVVEEATVRTPGGTADGREALIAQARRNHPPDEPTQHLITNPIVELDGDRAKVRANLVVNFAAPGRVASGSAQEVQPRRDVPVRCRAHLGGVALLQHRVQARVDITALRCLPGRGATGCRLA
jgi:SnoaL-like domain